MTSHSIASTPLGRMYAVQAHLEALSVLQWHWAEATAVKLTEYGLPDELALEIVHQFREAADKMNQLAGEMIAIRAVVGKLLPAEPY